MSTEHRESPEIPVEIPDVNIFDFRIELGIPTSILDVPGIEIQTKNPPYAPVIAGRTAAASEREQGKTPHILVLNSGHAQILYDYGLIDSSNVYRVTDKNGNTSVYAAVEVDRLLELAQLGEKELRDKNLLLSEDSREPQSYFGILASATYQQLNQVSLKTKSDFIERTLGDKAMARKMADHRRTKHSIIRNARSLFIAQETAQKRLVASSRYLLEQLNLICPLNETEKLDPQSKKSLKDLEDAVEKAETDLQTPRPPSTMP